MAAEGYVEPCTNMYSRVGLSTAVYRYARVCKPMNSFGGICIVV